MRKITLIIGFSLIAISCVISISARNKNEETSIKEEINTKSIEKLNDSLTIYLNLFSKASLSNDSIYSSIEESKSRINEYENKIKEIKENNKNLNKICIDDLIKQDLCKVYPDFNDSCKYMIDKYSKNKQTFLKLHDVLSDEVIGLCENRINIEKKNLSNLQLNLNNNQEVVKKIQYYSSKLSEGNVIKFKNKTFLLFISDNRYHKIILHWKNPKNGENYYNINSLLKADIFDANKPLMITNGGMYTPTGEPQGLFVEKYKNELKKIDTKSSETNANFYKKPNGVFYIDTNDVAGISETDGFLKIYPKKLPVSYATQSGPMLVIDGKIHSIFIPNSKNLNIRSGAGIIDDNKVVFIISKDLVNFYDFAIVFKDIFGCQNALYLDGAISLMYVKNVDEKSTGGNFGPMISVTKK